MGVPGWKGNTAHLMCCDRGRSWGAAELGTSGADDSICSLASKKAMSLPIVSITPVPPMKLLTAPQSDKLYSSKCIGTGTHNEILHCHQFGQQAIYITHAVCNAGIGFCFQPFGKQKVSGVTWWRARLGCEMGCQPRILVLSRRLLPSHVAGSKSRPGSRMPLSAGTTDTNSFSK